MRHKVTGVVDREGKVMSPRAKGKAIFYTLLWAGNVDLNYPMA